MPYAVVCNNCGAKIETIYKYRMFAAWNTRAAPRWIPVTERLPEENDAVLVVWKDGDIGLAFMHKDDWDYATHWMPLPLPPEEVE